MQKELKKITINKESLYKHYSLDTSKKPDQEAKKYWFVFWEYNLLVHIDDKGNHSVPIMGNELREALNIHWNFYIGDFDNKPCFVGKVSEEPIELMDGYAFLHLRGLYGVLDENLFNVAGRALQLSVWNENHQFCSRCGGKVETVNNEMAKKCTTCELVSYPRVSPAVIVAIIKEDEILLARNVNFPGNMFSLVAGFVEAGETLEECVEREVFEEVGVKIKNIQYLASQPWSYPHSMMIGYIAEYDSGEILVDGKEISEAYWFKRDQLPELPSRVSIARKIIDAYIEGGE